MSQKYIYRHISIMQSLFTVILKFAMSVMLLFYLQKDSTFRELDYFLSKMMYAHCFINTIQRNMKDVAALFGAHDNAPLLI